MVIFVISLRYSKFGLTISFCEKLNGTENIIRMMTDGVPTLGTTAFVVAASGMQKKEKIAPVKVKFTPEEDAHLLQLVQQFGAKDWIKISSLIGTRNPRQCRERFKNYLNPELRRDQWTREEDDLLEQKYKEFGAKWNKIAKFFVNRSDNALRNRWMMIARHRAKAMNGRVSSGAPVPVYTPPSPPAPVVPVVPQPMVTLPVVLPIVKECPAYQTRWSEDSFEMFDAIQEDLSIFCENPFEVWSMNDF